MEQAADRTGGRQGRPILGDDAPDFRGRAVPVVGADFHQQRDPLRPVDLVRQVLEIRALAATGPLLDRPFDVVAGHVGGPALEQNHAQPRVQGRVAAADFGRDADFLAQLRKDFGALRIDGPFQVLDLRPFAVSSHC